MFSHWLRSPAPAIGILPAPIFTISVWGRRMCARCAQLPGCIARRRLTSYTQYGPAVAVWLRQWRRESCARAASYTWPAANSPPYPTSAMAAPGRGGGRLREAGVLRAVSIVTAASAPVIEALSLRGIAAQRVPLGVDLEVWPPRDPVRRDGGRSARLLHVASLNRVKDQSTLLHALAALSRSAIDFEMDIVGEDTLNGEVQALAGRLRLLNTVRFHGFLTQRQLRPLMEAAHILVLASRHETGPVVALEAALAGVPTVGTAVGHIAEWSPDAALAVPIQDPARLAAAIRQLIEDEDLRLRMAREALKRAIRESADYTAERFRALYRGPA
jgi:glycosyltransferase involved in cell wall biosynthesis